MRDLAVRTYTTIHVNSLEFREAVMDMLVSELVFAGMERELAQSTVSAANHIISTEIDEDQDWFDWGITYNGRYQNFTAERYLEYMCDMLTEQENLAHDNVPGVQSFTNLVEVRATILVWIERYL